MRHPEIGLGVNWYGGEVGEGYQVLGFRDNVSEGRGSRYQVSSWVRISHLGARKSELKSVIYLRVFQ